MKQYSLLSISRKVYGKVIIERVQRITEEKISEEQGGFRKGRGRESEGRKGRKERKEGRTLFRVREKGTVRRKEGKREEKIRGKEGIWKERESQGSERGWKNS